MKNKALERIGSRLRLARERAGHTQDDAARVLGLKNRQTISQIENGERRLTAPEMVRLSTWLGVPVTYLTDRFEPTEDIAFSFRATRDDPKQLADFEAWAARWLTLFVELGKEQRTESAFLRRTLGLTERSSYEDAQAAAEEVVRELRLGEFPGARLADALGRELGVLLLHVEAPPGISGAAARLDQLGAILVNRRDSFGRRTFDVAHELFHLLTWEQMPPPRVEVLDEGPSRARSGPSGDRRPRCEHLADNFAAALLMPYGTVDRLWRDNTGREPAEVVGDMARRFRVSPAALAWRLHNLGLIDRTKNLPNDAALARLASDHEATQSLPPRFSREFTDRLRIALEDGTLSFRRAGKILGLESVELEGLFHSYGMASPYEA